ncbi:MAG: GMC family oxidoreductase [Acidobacteriota bacterium]
MVDVLIIGSGAGGGPLALTLSRAGAEVLVLERGPRHGRDAYSHRQGLQPGDFVPSVATDPHTVITRRPPRSVRHPLGWIATCVGGGTEHMGGYFYRFHPDDFRMRSRFGAALELADWPISYDDLEPYYALAEWEVGVSGLAEVHPFEVPRSRPYPMPPLRSHPVAASVRAAIQRRGLHPFPTPRSINSRPYGGRPACEYCRRCASYGCPVGARGTSQEALLTRAEATGRCEVRPDSRVREISVTPSGRAAGCLYVDSAGATHRVEAKVVCLCASAIESARLLLLSTSPGFPDGLGNRSGQVGRHLQFHAVTQGEALFDPGGEVGRLLADPHPFVGLSAMDHYFLPPGVAEIDKGGVLRFGRAPQVPEHQSPERPDADGDPTAQDGLPVLTFEAFHDFLPNSATFMDLDPDVDDALGLPAARIHLGIPDHHRRAGAFLGAAAQGVFEELGALDQRLTDVGGTSSYLVHGTCRAGTDPETSVLNADCQTHEVPNLFVVDGSFMPTSGGSAPTLTILANSFRVADRILEGLRQGVL